MTTNVSFPSGALTVYTVQEPADVDEFGEHGVPLATANICAVPPFTAIEIFAVAGETYRGARALELGKPLGMMIPSLTGTAAPGVAVGTGVAGVTGVLADPPPPHEANRTVPVTAQARQVFAIMLSPWSSTRQRVFRCRLHESKQANAARRRFR
jgi:hypothetical protein